MAVPGALWIKENESDSNGIAILVQEPNTS
jgi:hypothetical protein